MIDEKKLLKALMPVLNQHGDMYLAGRITGIIESQPQIGEWIPCSKKLPPKEGFYIVTYRFEDETFLKCHELYYGTVDGRTGWYLDDTYEELYKLLIVTAWRKLPKTYSPKERKKKAGR